MEDQSQSFNAFRLFDLNDEIQEKIFEFLSPRDLSRLSQSCKSGRKSVKSFIHHHLESFDRRKKAEKFFNSHKMVFKPIEREFLGSNISSDTTLNYYASKLMTPLDVVNFPAAEAEDFPHFGNSDYIVAHWDEQLDRNVALVDTVCWLKFIKKLGSCATGRYLARLHFYLGADSRWLCFTDHDHSQVRVTKVVAPKTTKEEVRVVLKEENLLSNYWPLMANGDFDNSKLVHSRVVPDGAHPGWHFFELESFDVEDASELLFEFWDTENQYWKSNVKFDQIEVTKMPFFK